MTDLVAALAEGSAMGGFFAIESDPAGDGWQPLADLLEGPGLLAGRVSATQATLAAQSGSAAEAVDLKVAASLMQLGLVARLVSPAVASMAVGSWVPDLSLARLRWRPEAGSMFPLAVVGARGEHCDDQTELADAFQRLVVDAAVGPVVDAVLHTVPVSPQVLWGNVWSALAGALTPLRSARPDLADQARRAVDAVLVAALADTGSFESGGRYRRTTCCLYYRLPRGGLCGDCVLTAPPSRG